MLIHGLNTFTDEEIDQFLRSGGIITCPESGKITICLLKKSPRNCPKSFFGAISFFGNRSSMYSIDKCIETNKKELKYYLQNRLRNLNKLDSNRSINDDSIYEKDYSSVIKAISDKKIDKCVLKSRQYFDVENFNLLQVMYLFLLAEDGLLYGMWDETSGYIGLTPETLVLKKQNHYSTMALAGTRSKDKKHELLKDPKEIHEHNLVIEDIKSKLNGESLVINQTTLMDFNNFSHLYTPISFESKSSSLSIIEALTPTAALGGYPSVSAKEMLKDTLYHQKYNDSFFGGTTFLSLDDKLISLVNIRNLQWEGNNFWIESGGGIVAGSTVEKEINEIKLKRECIAEMIFE